MTWEHRQPTTPKLIGQSWMVITPTKCFRKRCTSTLKYSSSAQPVVCQKRITRLNRVSFIRNVWHVVQRRWWTWVTNLLTLSLLRTRRQRLRQRKKTRRRIRRRTRRRRVAVMIVVTRRRRCVFFVVTEIFFTSSSVMQSGLMQIPAWIIIGEEREEIQGQEEGEKGQEEGEHTQFPFGLHSTLCGTYTLSNFFNATLISSGQKVQGRQILSWGCCLWGQRWRFLR